LSPESQRESLFGIAMPLCFRPPTTVATLPALTYEWMSASLKFASHAPSLIQSVNAMS
jgi:hypothetical protein